MTTGKRCHVCSGRFERSGFVPCPDCGNAYHEGCLGYHAEYECPGCATDLAVGAVEL